MNRFETTNRTTQAGSPTNSRSVSAAWTSFWFPMLMTQVFLCSSLYADAVNWSDRVRVGDRSTGVVAAGDFDRDGQMDVAYSRNGGFQWYRGPSFDGDDDEYNIGDGFGTSYAATAADMNNDGWVDLVASDGTIGSSDPGELYVFLNPGNAAAVTQPWQRIVAYRNNDGTPRHPNDLEVHDMDGDGRLDIVIRSWTESKRFVIAFQNDDIDNWTVRTIDREDGGRSEGLAVGDIDNDGRPEIVASGEFLDNDNGWRSGGLTATIDDAFLREPVKTAIGDLDRDGQVDDIVMAKAERQGLIYIAWYRRVGNPVDGADAWERVILKNNVTNYHAIEVADFDNDGHTDVLAGTGFNGSQGISIFYGTNNGGDWAEDVVSTTEQLYVASIVDLDLDGDLDIVGPQRWQNAVHAYFNQRVNGDPANDEPPLAPSNLQATAVTSDRISLQWSDNANNETEFTIERRGGGSTGFEAIASVTANTSTFTDLVIPNTSYDYRVFARNGNGSSAFSNVASVTTPAPPVPDVEPPSTPTALRATTVTFNRIDLTWAPSSDNTGIVGYRVYVDGMLNASATDPRFTIGGVQPETRYLIEVSAVDSSDNESDRSSRIIVDTPSRPSVSESLIAHWTLDETSGDTVSETTGNLVGTTRGMPQWQPDAGRFGGALQFSGGEDAVDIGPLDVIGNGLTLAAWVRPISFADGANEGRIISKASGTLEQQHVWMLSLFENGTALRLRLSTNDGGTTTLISAEGVVPLGQWTHVAATYDGVRIRLYVDGDEVSSLAKTGDITVDATVSVSLGNQPDGVDPKGLNGELDDVYIFDRAFDTEEIIALRDGAQLDQDPNDSVAPLPPANLRLTSADQLKED